MARPRKEGLDYFPHDCNLDDKFDTLELLYQNDGYAFGLKLYERIYKTPDGILLVSDAEMRQVLAADCHVSVERWEKILSTALKIKLFDPKTYAETGGLTSAGIQKRRAVVVRHREYSRSQSDSLPVSESETPHKTPERKQNKTKQNKTKGNENTPYSPPLQGDELIDLSPENQKRYDEVVDNYAKNVGPVTPPIRERIKFWIAENGPDLVVSAIREAAITGTHNPNYIDKVLLNWKNNGHGGT